jgi:23S rRNA (adenine2503-C2)-methyltransferase
MLNMTPDQLREAFVEMGERPFRARQVGEWVYAKHTRDVAEMTNLSAGLRERLAEAFCVGEGEVVDEFRSEDGKTAKLLFQFRDGSLVEAVSMRERARHTACLSSQVGCAMGCAFCATAGIGFTRDLTPGEILLQFLEICRRVGDVNRVVFMGMGEPLLNLESVLAALDALTDPARFGLGARRITISTCGLVEGIRELIRRRVAARLALALNSPFQDERERLMPAAGANPLEALLAACDDYVAATGRRVLLEYVLLRGVNATARHADAVARIARRLDAKVNLIEYNPVEGSPYASPTKVATRAFRDRLAAGNVKATVRYRRGRDIRAGCGQLAARRKVAT